MRFDVKFIVLQTLNVNQAQDVRTNEVVAIKKMSYSGKQSTEVRLALSPHFHSSVDFSLFNQTSGILFAEVARHHQGGEIPAKNKAPQQHRVQRMLPERAHCLGRIEH